MKKLTMLGAWLPLLALGFPMLAACGGGDGDTRTPDNGTSAPGASGGAIGTASPANGGEATAVSAGEGPGAGKAVVVINGERFDLDVTGKCLVLFGAMSASANLDGLELHANIPPEARAEPGSERSAPALRVNDTRESTPRWFIADPDDFPDQPDAQALSRVDTITWDGAERVFGTATFVNAFDYFQSNPRDSILLEELPGTYDIQCE